MPGYIFVSKELAYFLFRLEHLFHTSTPNRTAVEMCYLSLSHTQFKISFPQKVVDKKSSAGYNDPIPQKGAYEMMNRSSIICCSDTSSVVSFVRRASYAANTWFKGLFIGFDRRKASMAFRFLFFRGGKKDVHESVLFTLLLILRIILLRFFCRPCGDCARCDRWKISPVAV